jgi:hypothetical protein
MGFGYELRNGCLCVSFGVVGFRDCVDAHAPTTTRSNSYVDRRSHSYHTTPPLESSHTCVSLYTTTLVRMLTLASLIRSRVPLSQVTQRQPDRSTPSAPSTAIMSAAAVPAAAATASSSPAVSVTRAQVEATPLYQRTIDRLDARHGLPLNDESACAPVAALLKSNPLLSGVPEAAGFTTDLLTYAIDVDPSKVGGIYARTACIMTSELDEVTTSVIMSMPSDRPDINPKFEDFVVGCDNILAMLKHIERQVKHMKPQPPFVYLNYIGKTVKTFNQRLREEERPSAFTGQRTLSYFLHYFTRMYAVSSRDCYLAADIEPHTLTAEGILAHAIGNLPVHSVNRLPCGDLHRGGARPKYDPDTGVLVSVECLGSLSTCLVKRQLVANFYVDRSARTGRRRTCRTCDGIARDDRLDDKAKKAGRVVKAYRKQRKSDEIRRYEVIDGVETLVAKNCSVTDRLSVTISPTLTTTSARPYLTLLPLPCIPFTLPWCLVSSLYSVFVRVVSFVSQSLPSR